MILPTSNLRLTKVEDFRSPDGVRAFIFISRIGGDPIAIIQADTPGGDEAEVVLNAREAIALRDWLTRAIGSDETSMPRYLRPWVGTATMYAARMNFAVSDQWCQGFNACLNALDAAECATDSYENFLRDRPSPSPEKTEAPRPDLDFTSEAGLPGGSAVSAQHLPALEWLREAASGHETKAKCPYTSYGNRCSLYPTCACGTVKTSCVEKPAPPFGENS